MGVRGALPKPAGLLNVNGKGAPVDDEDLGSGRPVCPERFKVPGKEEHLAAWNRYIERLHWLTADDEVKCVMFVNLWIEYNANPEQMIAPKIHQLRVLGSELGMDPGNRRRIAGTKRGTPEKNGKKHGLKDYS